MNARTLATVYARWVVAKSEYEFEKWLRTQLVKSSQSVSQRTRQQMLKPVSGTVLRQDGGRGER